MTTQAAHIARVTKRDDSDSRNEVHAVRLVLPPAISANRYWGTRVVPKKGQRRAMAITYVTDEARAYKDDVGRLALMAGVRKPIAGRVALTVRMYPARPQDWAKRAAKDPDGWDDGVRSIDLDNCLKVLLDALKNIAFDERGARVEVEIAPLAVERVAPGLFSA
jgi:crossover junction endodeoxyribonuclease RusA